MTFFTVSANNSEVGVFDADSEQEAREKCARDAGYDSEAEMVRRLDIPKSYLVAREFA